MNKTFPLILVAILCLAIGWFSHYSLVPETTYIYDTILTVDSIKFVELSTYNPYTKSYGNNVVVVANAVGWSNSFEDLVAQKLLTTSNDTVKVYFYRETIPIFDTVPYPYLPNQPRE